MRVLHLLKANRGGTWAWRQAAVLKAAGADVVVALPPGTGLTPAFRRAGATVVEADLGVSVDEPWRAASALGRVRRLVDELKPDVIHTHAAGMAAVARLALGRSHPVPRVFQVRSPEHLEHPALRRLDLATAGPNDAWIATCRWIQQAYLQQGVSPGRVFLSHHGADLDRFTHAAAGGFRKALGVNEATAIVGMVAHMQKPRTLLGARRGPKGHEVFIEAFARVAKSRQNVLGVIVGGAWDGASAYEARLKTRGRELCGNALRFTGPRDDVPVVYRDLDVAVHPSRSDCGTGAVESLAAGCPTVSTDVGGLRDVVIHGRTGWVVQAGDADRLASAILQALGDRGEARRRASSGQELVRDLFDVERTGREVMAIYRRLTGMAAVEEEAAERTAIAV